MAHWQLDVSYKGVPFFVEATDDEGFNQRGAHHQYPNRNKGTWEALGKDDAVYNLSAYVTEFSPGGYAAARDKLIAACTAGGLGDLIHPYYGTKQVQCTGCRVTHSDKENGVARFSLSFIEADEPAAPAEVNDSAAQINAAADAAQATSLQDFADNWNLAGVPSYVYESASELAQDLGNTFAEIAGPLPGMLEGTEKFLAGTAKLLGVVQGALSDPMAFMMRHANTLTGGLPGNAMSLARRISGLGRLLSVASGTEKQAYTSQQKFMATGTSNATLAAAANPKPINNQTSATGQGWPPVPVYTHNRQTQARNQEAIKNLVERTAVIEASRMTPYLPLDNRQEAISLRDTLTEQLDHIAEKAPDTLYKQIETLRAAVVMNITKRGPELGRIGSHTPKTTRPALVLAYELYGDIGKEGARATELAARNKVPHPGFVPGGQALEVKLDA